MKLSWLALFLGVLLLHPGAAKAQARLETKVTANTVEVGQAFQVTLTAMVQAGSDVPSNPRLPAIPGVTIHGPSLKSQQSVVLRGGSIDRSIGVTAVWTLTAQRVGRLRIGPPTIQLGGQRQSGDTVVVTVVPQGQGPQRRPQNWPPDPFDLLRRRGTVFPPGIFDDPFDLDAPRAPPQAPPEYSIAQASDPIAFLRSTVEPARPVVGEQVTLTIYAYGARGPFEEVGSNEPQAADFLSVPLVEHSRGRQIFPVDVNGTTFYAAKVRQLALFPIRSGKLSFGAMKFGFAGRGYRAQSRTQGLMRQSELLSINVSEPPLAGRPPGYRIGDVGRFRLEADVQPRSVPYGEAVAVTATLRGRGNLPLKLKLPERKGVEFSDPTLKEDIDVEDGEVGGTRTFSYVAKLETAGTVDLGDITLAYFDPKSRHYRVAKAALGSVVVTGSPKPEPTQSGVASALSIAERFKPREQLDAASAAPLPLVDDPWFLRLLLGAPLFALALGAASNLWRRLESWFGTRGKTQNQSKAALAAASKALSSQDYQKAISELERGIFSAVETHSLLKPRAILKDQLASRLSEAGLDSTLADALVAVLIEIDDRRFAGGHDKASTESLLGRTKALLSKLDSAASWTRPGDA